MIDSGVTRAYGTSVASQGLTSVAVWNSDDTVFASNSKDGGRNWVAAPVVIGGGTASGAKRTYKDAIAFGHGNVYLAYEDKSSGSEEHMFSMSADGGDSWSAPTVIPSAGSGYITDIEVYATGNAIVVVSLALSFPNGCFVNVSTDNGATWTETRLDPATGDVDGVDASVFGDTVLVTYNDDSTGNNQTYAAVSVDGGLTFGPVATLSAGGNSKTAYPVCWTENGDMVVAWLEDDASISGTAEDVVACYSADNGVSWNASFAVVDNGDQFDADNLEVYHSQLNAGTGGMTNFVFENNVSGSDEVFCVSTDDYGVNQHEVNFGAGSYPRVAGEQNYVGVVFGQDPLGGYVENSMLAISRNGGVDFRPAYDVSMGASTGDSDYVEIAYDAAYDNFVVASVEDRTGQNQMYVGGSRAVLLEATVDATAHTLQLAVNGVGLKPSPSNVQIFASGASVPGSAILPDGRDTLMNVDPILMVSRSFAGFNVAIDPLGNGATSVISTPAGYWGATLQFAAVELLGGGMFGALVEPIAVTL